MTHAVRVYITVERELKPGYWVCSNGMVQSTDEKITPDARHLLTNLTDEVQSGRVLSGSAA